MKSVLVPAAVSAALAVLSCVMQVAVPRCMAYLVVQIGLRMP